MKCLWSSHRLQWHALLAGFLILQIVIKARVQLRYQLGASSHSGTTFTACNHMALCNLTLRPCSSRQCKPVHRSLNPSLRNA